MGNECAYDIEVFPNLFTVIFIDLQGNERIFEKSIRKDDTNEIYNFVKGRTLIGYNNKYYDNIVLNYIMRADPTNKQIYNLSTSIIKENNWYRVKKYKYTKVYKSIDLMSMLFSKSLRVGLKELQATMMWSNLMESKLSFTEDVPKDKIEEVIHYNRNDVLSTLELYKVSIKDITLRNNIYNEFDIECMSKSAVNIGVDLMTKFVCEQNDISLIKLKSLRKDVNSVSLGGIINSFIKFKDSELNKLLSEIKNFVVIPKVRYFGKRVAYKSKTHDKTYYFDVMNGGLHMVRPPGIVKPKEGYLYEQRDFGKGIAEVKLI